MSKKASVYTRGGDRGETSLVGGTRVSKGDELIDLYGEVDELNSHIGVVTSLMEDDFKEMSAFLLKIQSELFDLGSNLACEADKREQFKLPQLSQVSVNELEEQIDFMDKELPKMKYFILPGGHLVAAHLHLCRTVCRRVERSLIKFNKDLPVMSVEYINRLSDYFFILSRYVNLKNQEDEVFWIPKN